MHIRERSFCFSCLSTSDTAPRLNVHSFLCTIGLHLLVQVLSRCLSFALSADIHWCFLPQVPKCQLIFISIPFELFYSVQQQQEPRTDHLVAYKSSTVTSTFLYHPFPPISLLLSPQRVLAVTFAPSPFPLALSIESMALMLSSMRRARRQISPVVSMQPL